MKKNNKIYIFTIIILCIVFSALFFFKNNDKYLDKGNDNVGNTIENIVTLKRSLYGISTYEIDDEALNLTNDEKMVLEYINANYIYLDNYSNLQRYPSIYEGSQIVFYGEVKSVSYNKNDFVANVELSYTEDDYNNKEVVLSGTTEDARIIVGDQIKCYGRFEGVDDAIMLPKITSHHLIVDNSYSPSFIKYDISFIKKLAKVLFGNNIKVRTPEYGKDFVFDKLHSSSDYFMIVELDNQSNANFSKYEFYTNYAYIQDSSSTVDRVKFISFAADFKHYLISIYDKELKELIIEYYDTDLNKIWSLEFEKVVNPIYDMTENSLYLIADNKLQIIDLKTGTMDKNPHYVGERIRITKVKDGVLLFSPNASDAIMKTDNDGNILWTTKLDYDIQNVLSVQLKKDDTYVISINTKDAQYRTSNVHLVFDSNGKILSKTE